MTNTPETSTERPASYQESLMTRINRELAIQQLFGSPYDAKLLLLSRVLRLFAYGQTTLILALFLKALNVDIGRIGLFMSLTLFGDVITSLLLTLVADRIGRRRTLGFGALLLAVSGAVFLMSENYWMLVATAVIGIVSPSGAEIGPFRAIEESTIASLVHADELADLFAWYVLLGTLARALGNLICGWTVTALQLRGWSPLQSYKFTFLIYGCLGGCNILISLLLSQKCEDGCRKHHTSDREQSSTQESEPLLPSQTTGATSHSPTLQKSSTIFQKFKSLFPHISPSSTTILIKICLLFSIDSLASGLMPGSLITLYFHERFQIAEGALGTLFFVTNLVSSAGNLLASAVARRIGLIKTMVFTHLPSAVFLSLIPLSSNVYPAMVLLVLRSLLGSMDQAPRSAFLSAVMKSSERTAVMGIVTVTKTLSQSFGPVVTGLLAGMGGVGFGASFLISGAMKAGYDLGLLWMFTALHDVGRKSKDRIPDGGVGVGRDGDIEES